MDTKYSLQDPNVMGLNPGQVELGVNRVSF